jgi:uncharacterized protein (TIGR04255 family)
VLGAATSCIGDDPLVGPAPAEVPLPDAPLVRVIAQVRFSEILDVEKREFVAPFQGAIRHAYPILRQEYTQAVLLSSDGASSRPRQITWRFAAQDGGWRASLTPGFVSLETTRYTSRREFLERLRVLIDAVATHVAPDVTERLGLRYIDRIEGDAVERLPALVRPEILGVLGASWAPRARTALSEIFCEAPGCEDRIRLRSGLVPAQSTVDPAAIEPIDGPSFILDIDMFSEATRSFSSESISRELVRYAERIYAVFRWAVTDEFLRHYGGRL